MADRSVECDILQSLTEFTEALQNDTVAKTLTSRQIKLDLAPARYDAKRVKETRGILKVSQALFAKFLGVSAKTIRAWEQGNSEPSSMAARFMDEIRQDPTYWRKRLREEAIVRTAGC